MEDQDPKPAPEMFQVVNTVRSRFNRVQRYQSAVHARLKQHVGGEHRVLRGRPLLLSEDQVGQHLEELKHKVSLGVLEVRTADGRLVDLSDMSAASADAAVPAVNKLPDSAARDANRGVGENVAQFPGGVPISSLTADGNTVVGDIPGPLEAEPVKAPSEYPAGEELAEEGGDTPFVDPASPAQHSKGKRKNR